MDRRWYVAETKHRSEKLAAEELERNGFTTLLPLWNGDVIFQGYVFVKFSIDENWVKVNTTRGVKALLWGDHPEPLRKGEAEWLMRVMESGPSPELVKGMLVQIMDGPLRGLVGKCVLIKNRMVTLETETWPVAVKREHVQPIQPVKG